MTRGPWRPSISILIAMIVVSPIVVVSVLLVCLSWASSARVSESLGREVMTGAARSAATEVRDYLSDAVRTSDRYARRLEGGVLPDPPKEAWERPMLDDLMTTPNVASICYGNAAGDATWLLRGPGRLEIGRAHAGAENGAIEFAFDPAAAVPRGPPLRVYTYDPRTRPWWSAATNSDGPRWTPIYPWFAGNSADTTIGAGYVRKFTNPDGALRGVLVIDVTLGALSGFLRQLDLSTRGGRVFIIDNDGRLVAASHGPVTDDAGERNMLSASLLPTSSNSSAGGDSSRHFQPGNLRVAIDGAPARAQVSELNPYPGIQWRLITALPDSAFLADAQAVRRRSLVTGAAVTLASLALGVALSRYLSDPVLSMTRHVKRVGAGDFDARLHLRAARELSVLSDEINAMAGGLKQRMVLEQSLAVAMQVQQSLLPEKDPAHAKLDVAGRSRYCDHTGGDYFDFIDVAPLSESSLLLAVGDVMGHGIAAALLMASARASLRTNILDQPTLGQLMTRINRILAANNRHSRFMTMAILKIDGDSGALTWASAGHDPPILYHAQADQFRELDGGEIPLGIMEDVEFQEYRGESLKNDSVLVIATDGVWETFNEKDEQYGKGRLRALIRAHHASPAAALEADLAAFRGARSYADDVTFVIVKPVGDRIVRGQPRLTL
jgi:sigma-B regulation protein RsbU (phosphoserine phosphatase)